jgi:putative oxidoreductase
MIDNLATDARITNGTKRQSGRAALIALWVTQVILAAMFLMAGSSKLGGAPAMVGLFDAIGIGQWFRYVTGTIEIVSAIALLLPAAAVYGALLLIPTMVGAIVTSVFIIHASPAIPLVLLLGVIAVAWTRRRQLPLSR